MNIPETANPSTKKKLRHWHKELEKMMDKVSRVSTLLEAEAQVDDEKMEDTLEELINYTAILKAYVNQK